MGRLHDGESNALNVFTDGEVVVSFDNGEETVDSFENLGQEMELDLSEMGPFERAAVESVTFRITDAKLAPNREAVEDSG